MGSREHRILLVSDVALTESAQTFMSRSSIVVDVAQALQLDGLDPLEHDLIVLEETRVAGELDDVVSQCARAGHRVLIIASEVPSSSLLEKTEGFVVAPYSQTELITAIGEVLGTELRRALRLGVSLPTRLTRATGSKDSATVLQLSENGCLFEAESSVQAGEVLTLEFVLPSNHEELVVEGTVVSGNELQLLYGLRFDDLAENERLAILVFVELGLAAGASEAPGQARGGPR